MTNLSGQKQEIDFRFDSTGSSHDFRQNKHSQSYIKCDHVDTMTHDDQDILISIVPSSDHRLDYYDNQFIKQEREQIVLFLNRQVSQQEIQQKLSECWNYHHDLSADTPKWILREWCSFWLEDCLADGYNSVIYADLPALVHVDVLDLFTDLSQVLEIISEKLNVRIMYSIEHIQDIQNGFIAAQKLHGIQLRCNDWVNSILEKRNKQCPCITLFDEAWIQHLLRRRGYEIQCDGLEFFPQSCDEFVKLIYKNV